MATIPDVVESHLESIHLTAAKDDELTDDNKPVTLTKFDVTDGTELRELKFLNDPKGLVRASPGLRTMKGTLEMLLEHDSPIITMLKQAYAAREPVYIHCIEDATAAAGSQGTGYEAVLGGFPLPREAGALRSLSIELHINDFWSV